MCTYFSLFSCGGGEHTVPAHTCTQVRDGRLPIFDYTRFYPYLCPVLPHTMKKGSGEEEDTASRVTCCLRLSKVLANGIFCSDKNWANLLVLVVLVIVLVLFSKSLKI